MSAGPVRLEPSFVEKVWGTTELEPWFPNSNRKIGEVWFPAEEILVKFIYTTERLSVQVHPPGKTEMWYVLRAEPGARIALGFRRAFSKERLREAALSGEIEEFLEWFPISAGDTFFTPPGAVHAIGAGIVICEIQQNYPVTYRLYDYGRPRELHLDKALEVTHCEPHPGKSQPVDLGGGAKRLVACDYFVTDLLEFREPAAYRPDPEAYHLLVVIEGEGSLAGERFRAGELWRVPPGAAPFPIEPDRPAKLLRTYRLYIYLRRAFSCPAANLHE